MEFDFIMNVKKRPSVCSVVLCVVAWQRPILTGGDPPTTFGAETLNFRVRHGNGCGRLAIATRLYRACSLKTEDSSTQTIRLDQSLDRLVSFSSTCHHASTHDLSTSSSLRGLS